MTTTVRLEPGDPSQGRPARVTPVPAGLRQATAAAPGPRQELTPGRAARAITPPGRVARTSTPPCPSPAQAAARAVRAGTPPPLVGSRQAAATAPPRTAFAFRPPAAEDFADTCENLAPIGEAGGRSRILSISAAKAAESAAERRAVIEERLAAANGAVAQARGLLSRTPEEAGERGDLEEHLSQMVKNIERSLDLACSCAGRMRSVEEEQHARGTPGRGSLGTSRPARTGGLR